MEEVHMCKQYMHTMLPAVAGSLDLVYIAYCRKNENHKV